MTTTIATTANSYFENSPFDYIPSSGSSTLKGKGRRRLRPPAPIRVPSVKLGRIAEVPEHESRSPSPFERAHLSSQPTFICQQEEGEATPLNPGPESPWSTLDRCTPTTPISASSSRSSTSSMGSESGSGCGSGRLMEEWARSSLAVFKDGQARRRPWRANSLRVSKLFGLQKGIDMDCGIW